MKILHVLDHSLPEISGYTVRSLNILRSQQKLGCETVVATSFRQEVSDGGFPDRINDVSYYRIQEFYEGKVPLLRDWNQINLMERHLARVVETERPQVIHAHSPCWWGQAAKKVARRFGLPMVYEIRGFWEDAGVDRGKFGPGSLRYRLSRGLETRVAKSSDTAVIISKALQTDLEERGVDPGKIVHVPNVVDPVQFSPQAKNIELAHSLGLSDKPVVGFLGSLFLWEGLEDFLAGMIELARQVPEMQFLIVGGGEAEQSLRRKMDELGLAGQGQMLGHVCREKILDYYSLMDVIVYPRVSTRNTELVTPLKPLEAMAMERAVLGSDVGGVRELIPAGTGLLFEAGNPKDLARQCQVLLQSNDLRTDLGKRAREHVIENHHVDSMSQRYGKILGQITGHQPSLDGQPSLSYR